MNGTNVVKVSFRKIFESGFLYHFFWTNQQKVNIMNPAGENWELGTDQSVVCRCNPIY